MTRTDAARRGQGLPPRQLLGVHPGSGGVPGRHRRRARLTVSGYADTSHGRLATTVSRTLAGTSAHRWNDGETTDALEAAWTDDQSVTVKADGVTRTTRTHRTYTMNGAVTVGADNRLRIELALGDKAAVTRTGHGWSRLGDTYRGDATYTLDVPRDQREAAGTSSERYRLYGSGGCYDRSPATEQGVVTADHSGC